MPAKKYIVALEGAERERLNARISKGKAPAKTILKARILLKADQAEDGPGWLDAKIVEALNTICAAARLPAMPISLAICGETAMVRDL